MKQRVEIPQDLKLLVKTLHQNRCSMCYEKKFLHIHHLDENPENNELDNLVLLCREHHGMMHPKNFWKIAHFNPKRENREILRLEKNNARKQK